MKKTLIALAVGAAFVAPAAYADVTLSGSINMGLAYAKSGTGDATGGNSLTPARTFSTPSVANSQVTNNYSNITIGSLEDLGGGLKLDFAFQMNPNLTNMNDVANRNSHIGLVGDSWGGIWYGSNEMLYEAYYYTIDPLDGAAGVGGNLQMLGTPGYGVVFDAPGNGGNPATCGGNGAPTGCAGFYRRDAQSLWYNSPNWGGFTFGLYTTLSAFKGSVPGNPGFDPRVWGGGLKYVGPTIPIQAWVAYEKHKDMNGLNVISGGQTTGASGTSDNGVQAGVGYTLGDIFMFLNYEKLDYKAEGAGINLSEYKRNAGSIGVKWNIATGYVGAQYIQAQKGKCSFNSGATCNADGSGSKMIGLGYYHTLSKQSQAYVMYTYLDNDNNASYAMAGVGTPSNVPGASQQAITIGLKHSF